MSEVKKAGDGTEPLPIVLQTRWGAVECAVCGEGPLVLALHGAMGGYDQGLILARVTIASPRFRFVSISRPGYLGTPLASGRTAAEQADLCAAVLDVLNARDAAVVAVSGGGPCAIEFALRHKERCRAVVLISTCSGRIEGGVPFAFRVASFLARRPAFSRWLRRRSDPERSARRSIADPAIRARMLADPEARALYAQLAASTSDRMALRLAGTENDIAVTRTTTYALERIAVPVLVVHGTADRFVSFSHAKAFETRVPGAELLAIEGGEHACIFTHLREVRARITGFLEAY